MAAVYAEHAVKQFLKKLRKTSTVFSLQEGEFLGDLLLPGSKPDIPERFAICVTFCEMVVLEALTRDDLAGWRTWIWCTFSKLILGHLLACYEPWCQFS